ncbi:MAG TPA: DUF5666 domain-containing protein [Terriglobales bacterium]|nr:DUF5666 domain-containing protein [Terriglobales bacterium]
MKVKRAIIATFVWFVITVSGADVIPACFGSSMSQAQDTGQAAVARRIGAIKAINGNAVTLSPDSGPDIEVTVQPNARLLRIAPGAKDLTNATPVQLQDLQVGDRVRVRGQASADATSIAALEIIVIAHSDLEARHEQERQDWQKRGLGGLVSAVDAASGTVTISVTGLGGKKDIAVHTSKTTVFRRYAPDSVKFDDAKPSTLLEIQPGDQLRARGARNPDGSELTAEEIVTGSFRNIAGIVNSVDASAGTLSVQDLLSKKAVPVKFTGESQLHKLPPEIAQRIAVRLKSSMPPGIPGAGASASSGSAAGSAAATGNGQQTSAPSTQMSSAGGSMRQGGAPDLQQMLSRMPALTLADLHKGDAVLIVTTQGSATGGGTAITLLSGVEPILQAAPAGSQAMMLAPWSLGAPTGDAGP